MLVYAVKRILLMIPTLFAVSLLIFVLLNISAGDPGASQAAGDGTQDAQAITVNLIASLKSNQSG